LINYTKTPGKLLEHWLPLSLKVWLSPSTK